MATALLHLVINVAVAATAAWLTNLGLESAAFLLDFLPEQHATFPIARIASLSVFGTTLMVLATYHYCLQLRGAACMVLQGSTASLTLASWAAAGCLASMACGEGLVFYVFLLPPLSYLNSGYFEPTRTRPRHVVGRNAWYSPLFHLLQTVLRGK
jgi:hypothetical protein